MLHTQAPRIAELLFRQGGAALQNGAFMVFGPQRGDGQNSFCHEGLHHSVHPLQHEAENVVLGRERAREFELRRFFSARTTITCTRGMTSREQKALSAADCDVTFDNLTRQLYATDGSIYQIEPSVRTW